MSEQEKEQWRGWFQNNPAWVLPLGNYFNQHPELLSKTNPARMFWHDMINALVSEYAKQSLKARAK